MQKAGIYCTIMKEYEKGMPLKKSSLNVSAIETVLKGYLFRWTPFFNSSSVTTNVRFVLHMSRYFSQKTTVICHAWLPFFGLSNLSTKSLPVAHSAGLVATHLTCGMTTPSWSAWKILKDKTSKDRSQYPRQPHSVWSVSHLIAFCGNVMTQSRWCDHLHVMFSSIMNASTRHRRAVVNCFWISKRNTNLFDYESL